MAAPWAPTTVQCLLDPLWCPAAQGRRLGAPEAVAAREFILEYITHARVQQPCPNLPPWWSWADTHPGVTSWHPASGFPMCFATSTAPQHALPLPPVFLCPSPLPHCPAKGLLLPGNPMTFRGISSPDRAPDVSIPALAFPICHLQPPQLPPLCRAVAGALGRP